MSKVSLLECDSHQCNNRTPEDDIPLEWITLSNIYIGGRPVSKDGEFRNCLDFCCGNCLIDYFSTRREEKDG